jgi:hypothetical protein
VPPAAMVERVSDFKRSLYVPKIPGARNIAGNVQLTTSTGISSLDSIIGKWTVKQ